MADLVEVALPTDPLELEESPRISVPHQASEGQVDRIAGRPDPVDPLHPLDELLVQDDVRPLHAKQYTPRYTSLHLPGKADQGQEHGHLPAVPGG